MIGLTKLAHAETVSRAHLQQYKDRTDSLIRAVYADDIAQAERQLAQLNASARQLKAQFESTQAEIEQAVRWMLNFSDGAHSVLDIAEKSALRIGALHTAAELLKERGLLAPVD